MTDYACGTCGSPNLVIEDEGWREWRVTCGNGHGLIPSGIRYTTTALTVERLARAIHQGQIHLVHGDPEEQARRVLHALDNPEPN